MKITKMMLSPIRKIIIGTNTASIFMRDRFFFLPIALSFFTFSRVRFSKAYAFVTFIPENVS